MTSELKLRTKVQALRVRIATLETALDKAKNHLEWISWGDAHEASCARSDGLPKLIDKALEKK